MGFPIRTSPGHCFIASSPMLFAGLHVLRRLSSPRHPPDALIHLTLSFEEPFDFAIASVDYCLQLGFSTLIKLTALLCLNPAFCVSGFGRYNHHPNFCMTYLKDKPYFVCLLISACQFVKDRCVLTSQIKINYKLPRKLQDAAAYSHI